MQIKFIVSTFEDFTDVQIRGLQEAISYWYGVRSVRVESDASQQGFAPDTATPSDNATVLRKKTRGWLYFVA